MKTVKIIAAALLAAIAAAVVSAGSDTAPHNWYVKRAAGSKTPVCPPEVSFLEDHDAHFLNEKAAKEGDRVIYLTFDAGYENGNVARVLDALKEAGAPGAFFVLENVAKRNPDLLTRMVEEGHTVCNHTASHRDMTKTADDASFGEELARMEAAFREATGGEIAKFYRPPEGRFTERNLAAADGLGYTTVFWSFAYADWDNDRQPDPEKAKEKILSATHDGEIILLHPTSATNAEILPELLREWKKMGYRFGKLEELKHNDEKGA